MARSRTQAWLRDELVLALDLYRRADRNPPSADLQELSTLLRAIPVEQHLADNPGFRNANAVSLKIYNFVAIDPSAETAGMSRGGAGDQAVWDELADDRDRLSAAAAAIRANLGAVTPVEAEEEEPEVADAPEGRLLTRVHRTRERDRRLVQRKKEGVMAASGTLSCEGCGFDFADTYGSHGQGFIECHHTIPVSTLAPGSRTRIADLALVCANCHRMIHRRSEWLSMDELRALIAPSAQPQPSVSAIPIDPGAVSVKPRLA